MSKWIGGVLVSMGVAVLMFAACSGTPRIKEGIDPFLAFRVQPAAAEIQPTHQGEPWDPDGSPPDVRLTFQCLEGESLVTDVQETYTPSWEVPSCTGRARDLMESGFTFSLEDLDQGGSQPIANITSVRPTEEDLLNGSMTVGEVEGLRSIKFALIAPPGNAPAQ